MIAFFLGTTFGRSLAGGLVLILLIAGIYFKGHADGFAGGKDFIQSRWDAAEAAMLDRSIEARDEARADVPPLTEEQRAEDAAVPPRGEPCRVYVQWDRDCAQNGVRSIR